MVLVDSSVWVDYFGGRAGPHTDLLDAMLERELVLTGDLILTEVLQGFRDTRAHRQARALLLEVECRNLAGREIAVKAADNHRRLRRRGITVRKTIDVLIATFCIENGHPLLFSDCDFEPLVEHLGLRRA